MLAQAVRFAIATRVTTMRAPLTIYHNPACTKSRETLALLRERGHEPQVVEYLKTPPSEAELTAIVRKLGIKPLELVRTGEQVFKDQYKGKTLSDKEWIKAMVANPILIQRPIVVRGEAAAIGRPPQDVERLLR
jgi:arsenate reductase (glutaredoxin)